jgi:uncharacterized alkaline shock family protein YloU
VKEKESDKGFTIEGVEIAPGVIETIVSLAAAEVPGVAGVGTAGTISNILASFNAGRPIPTTGIELAVADDGTVAVQLTIQCFYGYRLVEVADKVRAAVADALSGQIGAEVSSVDIYVDGLAFEE